MTHEKALASSPKDQYGLWPDTASPVEAGIQARADFWSRSIAFGLDFVILTGLHIGSYYLILHLLLSSPPKNLILLLNLSAIIFFSFFLTMPLLMASYFIILHGVCGQTIGKLFMGIEVIGVGERRIGLGLSFLRFIGYIVSALPFAAGFLWAVVDKDKKAWHDHLALTRVVLS